MSSKFKTLLDAQADNFDELKFYFHHLLSGDCDDDEIIEIYEGMELDRYKIHNIEILIDKFTIDDDDSDQRLRESITTALYNGNNSLLIIKDDELSYYSKNLICPDTGVSYEKPEPNTFSFNSPAGMCKRCNGLGNIYTIDLDQLIPDKSKSIYKGGITALGEFKENWVFKQIQNISNKYDFDIKDPIKKIPKKALEIILYGGKESFKVLSKWINRIYYHLQGKV